MATNSYVSLLEAELFMLHWAERENYTRRRDRLHSTRLRSRFDFRQLLRNNINMYEGHFPLPAKRNGNLDFAYLVNALPI